MALSVVVAGGLLLALCGLGLVRTATPAARWLAMLVALGFAVVAGLSDLTVERAVASRSQAVELDGDEKARRTAVLRAAARAGPKAQELKLRWRAGLRVDPPSAALGAETAAPAVMPFAPEDVRIRGAARPEVDRPAMFEIEVDGLQRGVAGELVLQDPDGDILRRQVTLGEGPTAASFTPAQPGLYEVSLVVVVGSHRVVVNGNFEVLPPQELLVVESTGVVAAALRAQGERVRDERAWPPDWRRHQRVVLGRDLNVSQQAALVEAVRDGLGLFVLGAAFGPEGAPLRAILPVRPLPQPAEDEAGDGVGGDPSEAPLDSAEPPAMPPPPPPDRIGDTDGAAPISKEPVEVDKHAIAMVLVVDRSASMGTPLANGLTKMGYAKTSALRTAQALSEGDRVGLVTFGDKGAGKIELPLTDAMQRAVVKQGIEQLVARQEWTYLLSGLRSAHAQLRDVDAAVKHVVVISDGEFQAQDLALTAEAAKMRAGSRISVSIIAVVSADTDPDFKAMVSQVASAGGGQPLLIDDPDKIVMVVSSEVTRALSRVGRKPDMPGDGDEPPPDEPAPPPPDEPEPRPLEEPAPSLPEPPTPLPVFAVVESPLLQPEPVEWPALGAAVACEAPLDSRVLLVVGEQGWPLLSYANRGLGRVGAFAADLGGESGRAFREAADFPAWLAQWLAAVEVADLALQPEDVRVGGEVQPAAPVPSDLEYLRALGGGQPLAADALEAAEPGAVGRDVVEQVSRLAPLLLALLILFAVAERWLSVRALRRGDG